MTQEQRIAMRQEIIGPCTENQSQKLRKWLEINGEKVEIKQLWNLFTNVNVVLFDKDYFDWSTYSNDGALEGTVPTISFSDFKTKYMTP